MIELNESLYFAKGTTRKCFFHPEDDELCIKVPLNNEGKRTKGIFKAIDRENKFYKQLQKRNISWKHLSQYKGDVETNFGRGSVYQLIRDDNNSISQSLESYLSSDDCVSNNNKLRKALDNLFFYMKQNKILTTSLLPRNIVVNKSADNFKLVIVDDIGNSEFFPVSEFISVLAKRKITRKWDRMMKKITISVDKT